METLLSVLLSVCVVYHYFYLVVFTETETIPSIVSGILFSLTILLFIIHWWSMEYRNNMVDRCEWIVENTQEYVLFGKPN